MWTLDCVFPSKASDVRQPVHFQDLQEYVYRKKIAVPLRAKEQRQSAEE